MRHDTVMEKFLRIAENHGWSVLRAPSDPVSGGNLHKPDAVLYSTITGWVVDASVVAENADLDDAFESKRVKYDTLAIRDFFLFELVCCLVNLPYVLWFFSIQCQDQFSNTPMKSKLVGIDELLQF